MREKSNIDIINENVAKSVNAAIGKHVDTIADRVIEKLNKNNKVKREISYYRKVEILLYNYSSLKDAIEDKVQAIEDLKNYGLQEKSKSIVAYSRGSGKSEGDRYTELVEKYNIEKIETERELKRIDNALDKIRDDKYYKIIELKYLADEEEKISTDEKLAEKLECDRKTIARNRKRIINKLTTILFPESIREIM
ncbi:hypothetical protein [Clostridium paraputrificum]|uniref:hypothetical protein n=1 Tax=Clostridium paraputrificum TaxID=29363 RepID=UPI000C08B3B6|nr:hypothetical protein [Clostridium paraputrificum]